MRVVVDPGVLIAAALSPSGAPGQVLRAAVAGRIELIASPLLLIELQEVLSRPKFRGYLSEEEALEFVLGISRIASIHPDVAFEGGFSADPDDDYLVALARSGRAEILVSGDSDLLQTKDPDPSVLTPRGFLDRVISVQ